MKVLFHTNTLNYRGTTVALTDYAKYNETILGNESIICYNAGIGYERDMGSEPDVVAALKKQFAVYEYNNTGLEHIIDQTQADFAYFIRAGMTEPVPSNVRTGVHAVFQFNQPHGDRYAYISQWLSETMSSGTIPYVPHIVQLPEPNQFRRDFGISDEQIIVGRLGGYYSLDIPWVKQVIIEIVESNPRFVFVFPGTEQFYNHANIVHFPEIHDLQQKSNYINMCDFMIHGRHRGESFGLSIAEFLFFKRPVLAFNGGIDQNHIEMLKSIGGLYSDAVELKNIIMDFDPYKYNFSSYDSQLYSPTTVMTKFQEIFLS